MKQFYTQNGKTIEHPSYTVDGNQHKTITNDYCKDLVAETQNGTHFEEKDGLEFTYTVDDSQLDGGLNGALYFAQMDADGGKSKYGNVGAELGPCYCDVQRPHDLKFINNEANMEDWKPSETDPNAGIGKYGSCCTEIDIC